MWKHLREQSHHLIVGSAGVNLINMVVGYGNAAFRVYGISTKKVNQGKVHAIQINIIGISNSVGYANINWIGNKLTKYKK